MRQFQSSTYNKRRGQSLVEFALILPVLLLFIMGTMDFGRALFTYAQASSQLRQALRLSAVIGYDAATTPPYRDCDRMRATAQSVFFAESITPAVMYLRVMPTASFPSAWSGSSFTEPTAAPELCPETAGADVGPGDLHNGDIVRIRQTVQVRMITPLFPPLLTFTLQGQRTVVTSITLASVEYCGDLICQVDNDEDDNTSANWCPGDCATGGSNASNITLDDPDCYEQIPVEYLTIPYPVRIHAWDSDTGDEACTLAVSFVVNAGTPIPAASCTPDGSNGGYYTLGWTPPALGTYSVKAKVKDNNTPEHWSATTACNVEVTTNHAPTINAITPSGTVGSGSVSEITVDASDYPGEDAAGSLAVTVTVNKGYLGGVIGQTTATAGWNGTLYVIAWSPPLSGSATITVVAADSGGANDTEVSTVTFDTCGTGNCAPNVSISGPLDGATVLGTQTITITATDDLTDPLIVTVVIEGTPYPASGGSGTYTVSWDTTSVSNGSHSIVATADDGTYTTDSTPITVTVNNPVDVDIFSITGVAGTPSGSSYLATVTVVVKDNAGNLVSGVMVSGTYTTDGGMVGAWFCTTDGSGQCSYTSGGVFKNDGIRFEVSSLSHATLSYNATLFPPIPPTAPWFYVPEP